MLTGTLDDFTLADVLRLIAGAGRTGGLEVTRDEGGGTLHFRDGAVSGAAPAYARRTGAASPAGAIEDLTFDLVRWTRGEFSWTPGAAGEAGEADVDVESLLRDVSRRLDELAEIQTLVRSEEAVLAMAPQPPEGAVQINITPAEWRVLVLVDGHRSVADIAEATDLDDLEAMRLLYGLAAAGLVTGDATPPAPPVSDMSDMSDALREGEQAREEPAAPPEPAFAPPEPAFAPPEPAFAPPEAEPQSQPVEPDFSDESDAFLAELVEAAPAPASPFDGLEALPEDLHESPAVDRSTAARELAGLFDDAEPERAVTGISGPPRVPRRVEDDDQVTRGLISRLIDGVKGL